MNLHGHSSSSPSKLADVELPTSARLSKCDAGLDPETQWQPILIQVRNPVGCPLITGLQVATPESSVLVLLAINSIQAYSSRTPSGII